MKKPITKKKTEATKEKVVKEKKVREPKKKVVVSESVLEVPEPKEVDLLEGSTFISTGITFMTPLEMSFEPKEDITAYELAQCMKYFYRQVMPYEIDQSLPLFRHFKIIDHNNKA